MLAKIIAELGPWSWWVAGLVLLAAEMMVPGFFLVWIGLAALIVGASLLMQVPTSFQLLGYPGLAIVLFLLAAAGGIALALAILLGDR